MAEGQPGRDERRRLWDERHAGGDFEGHGPNPTLTAAVAPLTVGTALELACGGGTNAVRLASMGWRVSAVDWSEVALEHAEAKARAAGVDVEWLRHDLTSWSPPERAFDLVYLAALHLPPPERSPVYLAAARAVRPGGHFVLVGHDRLNATEGVGGQPAERLFTADEMANELTAADPGLVVERAEVVRQVAAPERGPIDALVVLARDS